MLKLPSVIKVKFLLLTFTGVTTTHLQKHTVGRSSPTPRKTTQSPGLPSRLEKCCRSMKTTTSSNSAIPQITIILIRSITSKSFLENPSRIRHHLHLNPPLTVLSAVSAPFRPATDFRPPPFLIYAPAYTLNHLIFISQGYALSRSPSSVPHRKSYPIKPNPW